MKGKIKMKPLIVSACVLLTTAIAIQAQEIVQKGEKTMEKIIMSLEKSAMERWRTGDPLGWAEISDSEIIYVDPGLTKPVEGLEEYVKYLRQFSGKINYQISEFINPQIKRYGNLAVLTYNYRDNYRDAETRSDGSVIDEWLWNTTEVYVRRSGEWKIIHTHWSYVNHKLPEQIEIPVLVKQPKMEYEGLLGELIKQDAAALERWRKGDPCGATDICAEEVTYFDSETPRRIDGLNALKAEYAKIAGTAQYDVMEFIDPKIRIDGDAAVLFYRFFSTSLNPDGSIKSRIPWNCTEVYAKIKNQWKVVHNHWSLIKGEVKK